MEVKYLSFEMGHLDFFDPRDPLEDMWRDMESNYLNPQVDIITVLIESQILMIAGCNDLRKGVGEVWLLLDKCYKKYGMKLTRATIRLMKEYLVEQKGYHRLQMAVDINSEENQKWAEHLGYRKEGLMKAYDSNRIDHHLYARVF